MSNAVAEGKELAVSESRANKLLFELWQDSGRQRETTVTLDKWLVKFPDFNELIEQSKREELVEAWPTESYERDSFNLPVKGSVREGYCIQYTPKGLLHMKEIAREHRRTHRQATVDGKHVDIRNKRGLMMATSPIENLLALAQLSVEGLAKEPDPKVKRAHIMYLRDLIGFRGHELPERRRVTILEALSSCTQETQVGNR